MTRGAALPTACLYRTIAGLLLPLARAAARVRGRVVAVEPIASNHARLRANLKLNDVAEVTDVCAVFTQSVVRVGPYPNVRV